MGGVDVLVNDIDGLVDIHALLEGEEININIFWNVLVDVCREEGLSEIVGEREDREMIGIHTETAGHTVFTVH